MFQSARTALAVLAFPILAVAQLQPPVAVKGFGPPTIAVNGTTLLNLGVSNPNAPNGNLTGISLSDTLPAGLEFPVSQRGTRNFCGGTVTITQDSITLSGFALTGSLGSCTVLANVIATVPGVMVNTTGVPTSLEAGNGVAASATLTVLAGPVLAKSFGPLVALPVGATTALTFTITNSNAQALTGVAFTDVLPAGITIAEPGVTLNTCGGSVVAVPGTQQIALGNGTVAANSSCTLTVNVVGLREGLIQNTSDPITSTNGGTGNAATASLFIGQAFQVNYAANLGAGESWINMTNAGGSGAGLYSLAQGQNPASVTGAICVNVYAFSPDEQMISCCACPVTPNGLANLGVVRDVISNPLTPATPSSVVVKLLASTPVGGTCNAAAPGPLAAGLVAWGTTLHADPGGGVRVTENVFKASPLSGNLEGTPAGANIGEYARLTRLCTFIQANGSRYGICRSCAPGALGAERK